MLRMASCASSSASIRLPFLFLARRGPGCGGPGSTVPCSLSSRGCPVILYFIPRTGSGSGSGSGSGLAYHVGTVPLFRTQIQTDRALHSGLLPGRQRGSFAHRAYPSAYPALRGCTVQGESRSENTGGCHALRTAAPTSYCSSTSRPSAVLSGVCSVRCLLSSQIAARGSAAYGISWLH